MPTAPHPLLDAVRRELVRHPPFDAMEPALLDTLAARLRLGYYPRGSVLTGPEAGVADRLYIIKQGSVRGGAGAAPSPSDTVLGTGECFPVGALVARRAAGNTYRAQEDSFCWELEAAAFRDLLERSEVLRRFCTGRLALLLERAQRARRAEAADAVGEGAAMLAPLGNLLAREPVWCTADESLGRVLAVMRDRRVGSMVVCDARRAPLGVFTTADLLHRIATQDVAPSAPIGSLMTPAPVCLEAQAPVVEAALAMARHGFRHVVVTRDGRLAGVVSERDLFALQRLGLGRVAQNVRAAADVDALAVAAGDIRALARHLLAQGIDAEHLTQMTSALNDAVAQRLLDLAGARHRLPRRWCWLALGSEGRLEQTLATDQDNALLFEAEGDAGAPRAALLAFAEEVNRGLEACGFPLCAGDIMARNPRWCLTLGEWRERFDGWIRHPQPEALLNAAIFFDFRPVGGEASLAGALRDAVLAQARGNAAFLRAMAGNALYVRPPLGLLGDVAPPDSARFPGTVDLKGSGARIYVDAARLLSLAHAQPATGTAARLRAAASAGALPRAEADAAVEAFHYLQALRLRRQYLEPEVAPGTANRIAPARLNEVDRRILRAAFRQAALLQDRLRADYAL